MKSFVRLWDRYWFGEKEGLSVRALRAIVYGAGSTYVFLLSLVTKNPPYEAWEPISFFKLLSGPLDPIILQIACALWLISAFFAAFGIYFRFSATVSFLSAVFYFGYPYNFGAVYHSTHIFVMALGILIFSSTSPDPARRWPVQLLKLYIVYVFTLCGFQKLYYGDGFAWALSESFYLRLLQNPWHGPVTKLLLESPLWVSQALAMVGLLAELLAPLALLGRRTGIFFAILWTGMHIFVHLSYGSHRMFFSQVFCYAVFIAWTTENNQTQKRYSDARP